MVIFISIEITSMHVDTCDRVALVYSIDLLNLNFAKLNQAPAPGGLSLTLFPNYPATRPNPANPTRPTRQGDKSQLPLGQRPAFVLPWTLQGL